MLPYFIRNSHNVPKSTGDRQRVPDNLELGDLPPVKIEIVENKSTSTLVSHANAPIVEGLGNQERIRRVRACQFMPIV